MMAASLKMRLRALTICFFLAFTAFMCAGAKAGAARVGLVIGEPFGNFGTMMPQGHASVYLADFCAEGPVHLRRCGPTEPGVVLSRFHDLRRPALDWMAVPLLPFLYGVEDPAGLPPSVDAKRRADLRESYRKANLREILPDRFDRQGRVHAPPYGDWEEAIGATFDRQLFLYTFEVPDAIEAAIADRLNAAPNTRRYTLGRENCADFAAELLRNTLPESVFQRNVLADFDMTTPKNLARELDRYGRTHPEFQLQVFAIPQLPGSLRRSRPLRGAAEGFVAEKRYILALTVLQPEALLACLWAYETRGKWSPGLDAIPLEPPEAARFVKPSVGGLLPLPAPAPPPTESASGQSNKD